MNLKPDVDDSSNAVLLVTTDPMRNPNYGGLLQAWALCETLTRLGYEPWIYDKPSVLQRGASRVILRMICRLVPRRLTRPWWFYWPEYRQILPFAKDHFRFTSNYEVTGATAELRSQTFVAYVTGSDQVWRPGYYDTCEKLLAFVPSEIKAPRVAYAASFGKNNPELYSEKLRKKTKPAARRLSSVSVREQSGIDMAMQLWDIRAVRVTDPVFLVEADHYRREFQIPEEQPTLVTYILDPGAESRQIISQCEGAAERLGISQVVHLGSCVNQTYVPVEDWIRAIGSAKYVLTDSFHGTAFSILFQRRFKTISNVNRGNTRFDTLFEIYNSSLSEHGLFTKTLADVTDIIRAERDTGIAYLKEALAPPSTLASYPSN